MDCFTFNFHIICPNAWAFSGSFGVIWTIVRNLGFVKKTIWTMWVFKMTEIKPSTELSVISVFLQGAYSFLTSIVSSKWELAQCTKCGLKSKGNVDFLLHLAIVSFLQWLEWVTMASRRKILAWTAVSTQKGYCLPLAKPDLCTLVFLA